MLVRNNGDQGFDDYRRERKRVQAKLGPQASVLGYENQALRELEQVEAREIRDQQLTREVHDFFAAATRQAATIVEKVARDAEREAGARIEQEVESFLIDALSRMNSFIVSVMQQRRNANIAETQIEPQIRHLDGMELDAFRSEGTADIEDKHFGQDPFATDIEEVQREFRAAVGGVDAAEPAAPIEEHLVAQSLPGETQTGGPEPNAEPDHEAAPLRLTAAAATLRSATAPTQKVSAAARRPAPQPAGKPAAVAGAATEPAEPVGVELERFKGALKALVRQGVMRRDEARAAWLARLESLGMKPPD